MREGEEEEDRSKKNSSNSAATGTKTPTSGPTVKYIIIAAVVATGLILCMIYIYHTFGTINPLFIVASGSMIPNLNIGGDT